MDDAEAVVRLVDRSGPDPSLDISVRLVLQAVTKTAARSPTVRIRGRICRFLGSVRRGRSGLGHVSNGNI